MTAQAMKPGQKRLWNIRVYTNDLRHHSLRWLICYATHHSGSTRNGHQDRRALTAYRGQWRQSRNAAPEKEMAHSVIGGPYRNWRVGHPCTPSIRRSRIQRKYVVSVLSLHVNDGGLFIECYLRARRQLA